jgi:hypothetical protein
MLAGSPVGTFFFFLFFFFFFFFFPFSLVLLRGGGFDLAQGEIASVYYSEQRHVTPFWRNICMYVEYIHTYPPSEEIGRTSVDEVWKVEPIISLCAKRR